MRQAALDFGGLAESSMVGQVGLRAGQVACPFAPVTDPKKFDEYVRRCLATWSVDVVLDDGQYLSMCRIATPQGNLREGFRRMLEFPKNDFSNKYWLGDKVVVGFLNGVVSRPVVLGCLFPVPLDPDPSKTLEDLAEGQYVVTDHQEWSDRHEIIDYTLPSNPVPSYTHVRDTAADRRVDHVVIRANNPESSDNIQAYVASVDTGALTLIDEHLVESGVASQRTTNVFHEEDQSALNLSSRHTTQEMISGTKFTHQLNVQDLAAKVLQLQQIVEVQSGILNQLVLKSTNAGLLELRHNAQKQTVFVSSNDDTEVFSVTKTTVASAAESALSLGAEGLTVLRRKTQGKADALVRLETSGDITVQSAQGSTVTLSTGNVSVKTARATVSVDDTKGISLIDGSGDSVLLKNGVVTVAAPSVSIVAPSVGLSSAAVVVGSTNTHSVPASDVLYPKLKKLEERIFDLETGLVTHTHIANKIPSVDSGVGIGSKTDFLFHDQDSLASLKGD